MKAKLTFLFTLIQVSVICQVPNGSFENWTPLEPYAHPEVTLPFSSINQNIFYTTGETAVSEVEGTEGSSLGIENLLIGQDTVVGFALFGGLPQGGGLVFTDGIPFTSEFPDTVRMHLKHEINESIPGSIFFQFFQEEELVTLGEQEDTLFIYSVSGSQLEWDTLEIAINEFELNGMPDECVVGFSSGDIFGREGTPGNYLYIDELEFISSSDTLFVSDFNTWADTESPLEIDDWDSFFDPTSGYVFQSDESVDGNFSLGLLSQEVDSTVIQSSVVLAEASDFGINPNQPLPEGAFVLSFSYKYETLIPDSARAVILLAGDDDASTFDITRSTTVLHETSDWIEVQVEFSSLADSVQFYGLEFHSGPQFPGEPADSSVLLIDDLRLLSLENCELEMELSSLDSLNCPQEDLAFSVASADSHLWFMNNPLDQGFLAVSDEESFSLSFIQEGLYEYFSISEVEGCFQSSDTLSFQILSLTTPSISADGLESITMCANSDLVLSVENSSEFSSYNWFSEGTLIENEVSGTLMVNGSEDFSGTYMLEAESALCAAQYTTSNTVTISTYPLNLPEINQNGNNLSTGTYASFQWFYEGEALPGAIAQFHTPLNDGNYSVQVEDEFGCQFMSESYFFSEVRVKEIDENSPFIYPNPFRETLNLTSKEPILQVTLMDSSGRVLCSVQPLTTNWTIHDLNLTEGTYFLSVQTKNGRTVQKLIRS